MSRDEGAYAEGEDWRRTHNASWHGLVEKRARDVRPTDGNVRKGSDLGTERLDPVWEHRQLLRIFLEHPRHHRITHRNYTLAFVHNLHLLLLHIIHYTMLQRTILRASRQQTARQIRAFAPLRQQAPITRAVATPAIRWYSDAAPAKEGEAAEKKEDAPAQNNEATQLKEQLEKKDKEVVELKVRI